MLNLLTISSNRSLVSQAIIRCCSHPLKSTVEQQLGDVEPDLSDERTKTLLSIGKTITYENYIPLWKSILSVTSLKEFDTSAYPIFDRQNMLVSLYDEMIDSILHIIDRLDLSVDKEKSEVSSLFLRMALRWRRAFRMKMKMMERQRPIQCLE